MTTKTMTPTEKAKEMFHELYKMPQNNFFDAKSKAIFVVDKLIEEATFGHHLRSLTWWKSVKQELENL